MTSEFCRAVSQHLWDEAMRAEATERWDIARLAHELSEDAMDAAMTPLQKGDDR